MFYVFRKVFARQLALKEGLLLRGNSGARVLTGSPCPEQQALLSLQDTVFGKVFDFAVLVDTETGLCTEWPHIIPLVG